MASESGLVMHQHPERPSVAVFWGYWLRLGCISVGGPAAQIALMHQELVVEKRWISEARFLHALNYCMLLPGPEAQQMAVYTGWLLHGVWGGIVAGSLFVLPAFALLLGLSFVYMQWGNLPEIAALLYGVKPLVIALVFAAAWRLSRRVLRASWLWAVTLAAFGLQCLHVPFPAIILMAALVGWFVQQWFPAIVETKKSNATSAIKPHLPCVIDDNTPSPGLNHLRQLMLRICIAAVILGLGVLCALWLFLGWQHVFTQLALFFGKAAFLTFGGAYAVLPYVFDVSVQHFHWLNATQMLDGLVLGESTPGPLIMVLTYIGFVAGWQAGLSIPLWQAGLIGATVVTWFTFLPSFLLVFLGAPWLERSRQQLRWAAPLTAISAAVIAGIVYLAAQLTQHVVFPDDSLDLVSTAMALIVFGMLLKTRVSILWLLIGCMTLGWLLKIG
jgi:chromate transporter